MSHFESLNGIFAIEDMAGKKYLTKTSLLRGVGTRGRGGRLLAATPAAWPVSPIDPG